MSTLTLQNFPQTRLLLILVEEVVYNQNLNDAQLASLSVLSYSRWRPRWRCCIKTFLLSQVVVIFDIVIHAFRCFISQQMHLERFQSTQSSFNSSKVNINAIMSNIATAVKPKIKKNRLHISQFEQLFYIIFYNLLNNTTLCANWSLPWGVLRS